MSASISGRRPDAPVRYLTRGLVAAAALAAAGCAQNQTHYEYAEATKVAGYVAEAPQIESDGLPTQPAPSMRIHQVPDDPAAPYSRNYGGANPSQLSATTSGVSVSKEAERPYIPNDLPPDFRNRLAAAVDTAG